jgi:hypothetical protein
MQQAMEELRRVASGDAELEDLNLESIQGGHLRSAPLTSPPPDAATQSAMFYFLSI